MPCLERLISPLWDSATITAMTETREIVFHLIDTKTSEVVLIRDTMDECFKEARKLNKKEGYRRYKAESGRRVHIERG